MSRLTESTGKEKDTGNVRRERRETKKDEKKLKVTKKDERNKKKQKAAKKDGKKQKEAKIYSSFLCSSSLPESMGKQILYFTARIRMMNTDTPPIT